VSLSHVIETIDRELDAARDRLDELVVQAQRELDDIARLERAHIAMTGDVAGPAVDGSPMTPEELRALVGPPPAYPALEAVKDPGMAAGDTPATSPAISPPTPGSFSVPTREAVLQHLAAHQAWTSTAEIISATGRSKGSVREALGVLLRQARIEAKGATKSRRFRVAPITTSPAGASAGPATAHEPAETALTPPPDTPQARAATTRPPAGEDTSKGAPAVSARVRKQLEREAAAAELEAELADAPPAAAPVVAERPVEPISELVLKQLSLYDQAVTARTIAQALFRNQNDVAHALRDLAAAGRCTSHRSDGITLYAAKAAA